MHTYLNAIFEILEMTDSATLIMTSGSLLATSARLSTEVLSRYRIGSSATLTDSTSRRRRPPRDSLARCQSARNWCGTPPQRRGKGPIIVSLGPPSTALPEKRKHIRPNTMGSSQFLSPDSFPLLAPDHVQIIDLAGITSIKRFCIAMWPSAMALPIHPHQPQTTPPHAKVLISVIVTALGTRLAIVAPIEMP